MSSKTHGIYTLIDLIDDITAVKPIANRNSKQKVSRYTDNIFSQILCLSLSKEHLTGPTSNRFSGGREKYQLQLQLYTTVSDFCSRH